MKAFVAEEAKYGRSGAELCALDFIAEAAVHYEAGDLCKWASCLRLAGEFATDVWRNTITKD